jgi:putative DNA primase/helicase
MTAKDVAAALGGADQSGGWWRCRCPVHGSRGSTLALRDGERGLLVKCHAGCSRGNILNELDRRGIVADRENASDERQDPEATRRRREADDRDRWRRISAALDKWQHETCPAAGSIVETYLRSRRITLPPPPTIRRSIGMLCHRESDEWRPAMVALVEHVEYGPVGVHITYLAIDGSMKATIEPAKRSLGPVGGGAVRLAPAAETLMVGEGIETCLAVMAAIGRPAWAALSTSGLMALVLPAAVREVIILADHDTNGAGERAARFAAKRWLSEGRRVWIAIPPEPDTDFADLLVGCGAAKGLGASRVAG